MRTQANHEYYGTSGNVPADLCSFTKADMMYQQALVFLVGLK